MRVPHRWIRWPHRLRERANGGGVLYRCHPRVRDAPTQEYDLTGRADLGRHCTWIILLVQPLLLAFLSFDVHPFSSFF